MKITNILVPVNFSDCSHAALEYSANFASNFNAKIHLFHVKKLPYHDKHKDMKNSSALKDYKNDISSITSKKLREYKTILKNNSITHIGKTIWDNSIIESIKDYSDRNDIDLIIMGTHGRSKLSNMLLGNVTEKIIKYTTCPVLTIKKDTKYSPISKILASHDLSPYSTKALRAASKLSKLLKNDFQVIHVIPEVPHSYLSAYGLMSELNEDLKVDKHYRDIRKRFKAFIESKIPDHKNIQTHILMGKPSSRIVEYAKENNVGLIVIGGRGHGNIEEHLLGSTADRVIRKANCTVLIV